MTVAKAVSPSRKISWNSRSLRLSERAYSDFTPGFGIPMIAPAMNTRPDEQLPYQDLAGQGAWVVRSVQADGLVRLAELAPGRGTMHVDMAFSRDSDGRPWVSGTAELAVDATCQRCLEVLERPLRISFDLCI